ncbi:PVC-type heme-binding CxxCH protein [Allorhodopirellula solitaria]|uniref:Cytochrome c domain-containing protein n=1 Tax=Allorhodopirellula solitaria TaxID=2527987 RepID=A0A5C5WWL0_9BACT|nr:PVC-type heme-binding CxxCH protein [Allorhodopirellula solitaria]TWT55334.1 hypothetical protein CA85_49610 [Allorhodopirellula solitaria]
MISRLWFALILSVPNYGLLAQNGDDYNDNQFPPRPTPEWVEMADQGAQDLRLAGIRTPAGIKVEIVAEEPTVIDPVGMTFADDGTPHVLQWTMASQSRHETYDVTFQNGESATINRMWKNTPDELKTLQDRDHDGVYDATETLMDDLEIPSSVLLHDGWTYLSSLGHVVRRKQSIPGGAFDLGEEIVRGLCGFHHHQASGMTIGTDGSMFITSGDDDNRAEGSDGSRATVLRTGAIFRCNPDGSDVHAFARGFRNPYRDVAFDPYGNIFHVDNDQEDGSKFQGVRLMHVLEGADYGWRLYSGAVCCRTDFVRGAVFGEKPGKMPSMLKTGRGAPAGLMIYEGTAFPDFVRGLLIYPDVYRKLVRAFRVERVGSTFEVVEEFTLMTSDDGLFRPCQALQGPDGAIYIVDWRTDSGGAGRLWGDGEHGRIYRLSWSGTDSEPAIALQPRDSWSKLNQASDEQLWETLDGPDLPIRKRAIDELDRRCDGDPSRFADYARDQSHTVPGRIAALGGACRQFGADSLELMVEMLADDSPEIRRTAANAISWHAGPDQVPATQITGLLDLLEDPNPAAQRAIAMMVGQLAGNLPPESTLRRDVAARLFQTMLSVERTDVYLFDGFVRGIERIQPEGPAYFTNRLTDSGSESSSTAESDRAREIAVVGLESMRTRSAAAAIDALLARDTSALTDDQLARVIATYRQILVEPPVDATALADWLASHPDADVNVRITAFETIGLLGGADEQQLAETALSLLSVDDEQARTRVIAAIGDAGIVSATAPLVAALAEADRSDAERQEIVSSLAQLRSQPLPFTGLPSPPGVETVLDELAAIAIRADAEPVRGEVLALLAQVDFGKAKPVAYALLDGHGEAATANAITVLGANPDDAKRLGEEFLAGKIDRGFQAQVVEVLLRHGGKDGNESIEKLRQQILKGGLLVSLQPSDVRRVEELVQTTGDPSNGRTIYFDTQRGQCSNCHQLEGKGGSVGPDLSKIYETHTVAKIIESIADPSKEIKEGFDTWNLLTLDGAVYSGLKMSESEEEVVLRDPSGKDIRVPVSEIESLSESKHSLMPEGVVSLLDYQEFLDLIAFLRSREAQEAQ